MLRCLFFLCIAALLSSCAKPPLIELDAAEYMVNRARENQAPEFAQSEYLAAQSALRDAHKSMETSDYRSARDSLEFALLHARRAVLVSEQRQARRAAAEANARRRAREEALARQKALQARAEKPPPQPEPPPPPKPAPKPKPKVPPVTRYDVGEGETLWTIAAEPQVYNEGMLWPLLYQANRDQIKDPREIYPGQVLSIPRDMTTKELEEARQKARESDIFPIPGKPSPGK